MKFLNNYIILIIGIILIATASNMKWGSNRWKGIIDTDGVGYYSYLPALFIYHDLQFSFYDTIHEKYYPLSEQEFRNKYNGKIVDKYYVGTAVAMAPFFLLGHAIISLTDEPADGYSKYYNISINIAAIFYLLVALYFIRNLLQFYLIPENINTLLLFALTFGTNIFYYTTIESSMSHIYSLAFVSAFLYYCKDWFITGKIKNIFLISFLLGLITLIRPVNIILIISLPFVAGDWQLFSTRILELLKQTKTLVISILLFLSVFFVQLIFYKIQCGHFIVYSYTHEKFYWLKPAFFRILFSYKKGLFVYTPLILLSLTGLIYLYKTNKFSFYSFIFFFLLLTYILSAWWCWYYGGSFGMRAYIEFYPLMAILLGLSFRLFTKEVQKKSFIAAILILTLVCQIQTYQFRYYYIHWSDMTKESYWNVFMRVDWLINKTNKPQY